MKKKYIIPITELVVVNLLDSVLQDEGGYDVGGRSDGTPEMTTNKGTMDLDDDVYDLPASKSLWE